MIKFFTRHLNRYKLHPVELKNNDNYEIIFQSGEESVDVTKSISLIGLNKLSIAIQLPVYSSCAGKKMLRVFKNKILRATLRIKPISVSSSKIENSIYFFEISSTQVNGRRLKKYSDMVFLYLKNVTNKKSKNFIVPAKILFSLFAFCIRPRPVYVICIGNTENGDVFPIDITGNIFEDFHFFSLRKTSPGIQKIIDTKKVCLCLVPFNKKNEVYSLGKHHKDGRLDFNLVNFKIFRSTEFKIPVPAFVINVNELKVVDYFDCGVHTVFYAKTEKFLKYSDELPLAHTPWYNL